MSTDTAEAEVTVATDPQPTADDFRLQEAMELPVMEGAYDPASRTVRMHVIRPCVGRGKGRHVYTAKMLRENAHKFTGWKMYIDHQSEEARRKAGGLPRGLRDYGGRVLESSWDESVPADASKGYGQGAVVATVRPSRFVREFLEDDPEGIEASINARATAVSPTMTGGKQAWIVEGIEDTGSIDWVTEGGAGGRVVSLMEAVYHDREEEEMALLEQMTDEEFARHVRDTRPELFEALSRPDETRPEGGNTVETTAGAPVEKPDPVAVLREALSSDEGRAMFATLMEAEIRAESDIIRAQAAADSERRVQVRDLRDDAHRIVREAKLPAAFEADLLRRYTLDAHGRPSRELDVVDEIDSEGRLVKEASAVLRESVADEIKRQRELIEAVSPTRVSGQGPEGEGEGEPAAPGKRNGDALWRRQLREAGFEDPDEVYDLKS